jgi:hypothetical protein
MWRIFSVFFARSEPSLFHAIGISTSFIWLDEPIYISPASLKTDSEFHLERFESLSCQQFPQAFNDDPSYVSVDTWNKVADSDIWRKYKSL